MRADQRFPWGALLAIAGALSGCGGSQSSDESTWESRSGQPSMISGREVSIEVGGGAPKSIAPEDFHRHEMQSFRAGWHQSDAAASLQLLISAIGPKPLLEHLEHYRNTTQNPEEAAVAGRFIDIIHQAYDAPSQSFKRLTISLQGGLPQITQVSYEAPVTLPVLDRKTGQKMVLTLAAKESIVAGDSAHVIRIRNDAGQWVTHDTSMALVRSARDGGPFGKLINFAVTGIAPAS